MPRLPRISSREAIRGCVVPAHSELKIGTLSGLLKQAKVDPQDFIDSL